MRVAVVWNHDHTGVIKRFGQFCPQHDRETVESVVAALQEGGHETLLCEGDKGRLTTLERFMLPIRKPVPPESRVRKTGRVSFHPRSGHARDGRPCVHRIEPARAWAGARQGHHQEAHPRCRRADAKLSRDASRTESTGDPRFPMVVEPRHGFASFGVQLVYEPAQLWQAVEVIVTQYAQDALVEEYIEGREIWIALLGNGQLEVLPLVEQDFGDRETRLLIWEAKHIAAAAPQRICPAQIGSKLATVLRDISVATFRACQCRDYARLDLRIDRSGQPFVLRSTPCRRSVWSALMSWPRRPPDAAFRAWSIASSMSPTRGISEPAFPKRITHRGDVLLKVPQQYQPRGRRPGGRKGSNTSVAGSRAIYSRAFRILTY